MMIIIAVTGLMVFSRNKKVNVAIAVKMFTPTTENDSIADSGTISAKNKINVCALLKIGKRFIVLSIFN